MATASAPAEPPQHLRIQLRAPECCFLCRTALPSAKASNEPQSEDWELENIGLVNLSEAEAADLDPQVYTFRWTQPRKSNSLWPRDVKLRHKQDPSRTFYAEIWNPNGKDDLDAGPASILCVAHVLCWKIAQKHQPITSAGLYKLGQQTWPILPKQMLKYDETRFIGSVPDPAKISRETGLGSLLAAAAMHLPVEMQEMCIENSGLLSTCLMRASRVLAIYSTLVNPSTPPVPVSERLALPDDEGGPQWLCAQPISMFGQVCLRRIKIVRESPDRPSNMAISVRAPDMVGLRFVLGTYGLRGICIVYRDGSISKWLGDAAKGAYGTIRGSGLENLRILQDDLKIIRVSFEDFGHDSSTSPNRVLWDENPERFQHDELVLADSEESGRRTVPFYQDWRIVQHLRLMVDGVYASGLVIWQNECGIQAIIAVGKKRYICGKGLGRPQYFHIRPDERLTFACQRGIRDPRSHRYGPFIHIGTDKGRSASFGPTLTRNSRDATWSVLTKDNGPITGLIFEHFPSHTCGVARAIGVCVDTSSRQRIQVAPPTQNITFDILSPVFRSEGDSGRLSTYLGHSSLSDVARIRIIRSPERCYGLGIEHHDGLVESLGWWEPGYVSSAYETIYSSSDGPLESINFWYSRDSASIYQLTRISAGKLEPGGRDIVVWSRAGMRGIIWQHRDTNDSVTMWDPPYVREQEMAQISIPRSENKVTRLLI